MIYKIWFRRIVLEWNVYERNIKNTPLEKVMWNGERKEIEKCQKVTEDWGEIMEKDFLYKVSEKLYDSGIWKKKSSLLCPTKVKQNIGTLYPGDAQNRIRQHVIQKIRKCFLT